MYLRKNASGSWKLRVGVRPHPAQCVTIHEFGLNTRDLKEAQERAKIALRVASALGLVNRKRLAITDLDEDLRVTSHAFKRRMVEFDFREDSPAELPPNLPGFKL